MNAESRTVALTPRIRPLLIKAFADLSQQGKSSAAHIAEDGTRSAVGFMMTHTPDSSYNMVSVRVMPDQIKERLFGFLPTYAEVDAIIDAQTINDSLLSIELNEFFSRQLYNRIKNAYGFEFAEDCRLEMKMSQSQTVN